MKDPRDGRTCSPCESGASFVPSAH